MKLHCTARKSEMTNRSIPSRNLAITAIDQFSSSASNFLFVILLAISSSSSDFARSSTIWTTISFTIVIQRSVFGVPLILDSNQEDKARVKLSGSRMGALLLAIPGLLLSTLFYLESDQEFFLLIGLLIPLLLLQDLGRYLSISQSKGLKALASDTFILFSVLVAIGFSWVSKEAIDPLVLLFIFAFGVVGAAIMIFGKSTLVVSQMELRELLRKDRDRRLKLFMDAFLISGTAIGSVLAVWLFYGSQDVAAFNGALTALAPIGLATLMVQLVVQHGIVGSDGQVKRREIQILFVLAILALAWLVLIISVPASFGTKILGETWILSESLFMAVGFSLIVGMLLEFLVVALRSQGSFARVVKIRRLSIYSIPVAYLISYSTDRELSVAVSLTAFWGIILVLWVICTTNPLKSVKSV